MDSKPVELKPEPPKTPTVEEKQLPSQGLLTEGGASKDKDDKAWTDKAVIVSYIDINSHRGRKQRPSQGVLTEGTGVKQGQGR